MKDGFTKHTFILQTKILTCFFSLLFFSCFLSYEPGVGLFLVPTGVVLFFTLIFLLCIFNAIRNPLSPSLVENQETEDVNELPVRLFYIVSTLNIFRI